LSYIYSLTLFFSSTLTTPTTTSTLSLHDALPIYVDDVRYLDAGAEQVAGPVASGRPGAPDRHGALAERVPFEEMDFGLVELLLRDRKSTRLNSSHLGISYAVFCLKKKKNTNIRI